MSYYFPYFELTKDERDNQVKVEESVLSFAISGSCGGQMVCLFLIPIE